MTKKSLVSFMTRIKDDVSSLMTRHQEQPEITHELAQLQTVLTHLQNYLSQQEALRQKLNDESLTELMQGIEVRLVILEKLLPALESRRLRRSMKGIQTLLKFHALQASRFYVIIAWLIEWMYFV